VYCDISLGGFENVSLPNDLAVAGHSRGARALIARVEPSAHLGHGDALALTLDLSDVHLFDAATSHNLALAAGRGDVGA